MRSGMVAVVGRPNVGKSSLVNALVGQKVSIVTPKPQTTRHRVQGVLHRPDAQIVFVDTPGLHRDAKRALNRALNQAAVGGLAGVEQVLFVVEAGRWQDEDDAVLLRLRDVAVPVGLVINKVDRLADKTKLLPEIEQRSQQFAFAFVVPVSATKGTNLDRLVDELARRLPEGPALYPQGQAVAHDLTFTIAELVREKLMLRLQQELPYALAVEIESLESKPRLVRASAVIWVERDGQKKIVVGEGGAVLKSVGSAVRRELEKALGHKVFLKLWVRVKEGWTDDADAVQRFGYSSQ